MMILASIISFISMLSGITIAYLYDFQAGASIVIVLAVFSFILALVYRYIQLQANTIKDV